MGVHRKRLTGSIEAVVGITPLAIAALQFATTTPRRIGTTILACAWSCPSSSRDSRMAATEQMLVQFLYRTKWPYCRFQQ